MHYPIAIETGTSTEAYGVVVPDLPGCFSAGDTLDEAMENAKEAIELGSKSPSTTRIDQAAKAAGESRSGYIARRALG